MEKRLTPLSNALIDKVPYQNTIIGRSWVTGLTYFALVLILILGLNLRSSGTLNGFFAFTYDQGRDFLRLYDLVYKGDISFIGPPAGIDGLFHGVWWHWFLAPVFWVTRGNPQLTVFSFNLFAGFWTVLLSFVLGKKMEGKKLGLILATIVAVSPFYIERATQLWHPFVVPLLITALLYAVWEKLNNNWSYVPIGFILGAIFEFEVGFGGLFIPSFIFVSCLFKILPQKKELLPTGLWFGIWLMPRVLFEIKNHFLQTKSVISYIFKPESGIQVLSLAERFIDRTHTAITMLIDAYAQGKLIVGLIIFILIVMYFIHSRIKANADNSLLGKFLRFNIAVIITLVLIASLYPGNLWVYYFVGLPVFLLPVVGVLSFWLIQNFKKTGILLFIAWFLWHFQSWVLPHVEWAGDASVYKNQLAVVDYIYKEAQGERFNVAVYSPSLIDYNYQYLFLWQGKNTYGYIPDRDKSLPLAFFIIEPDPWNKGLRQVWIKEREGDGVVAEKRIFSGEIEVEKRIRNNL